MMACCKSDEVSALYPTKIHQVLRDSDQFSNRFCLNIGTKYHGIPHREYLCLLSAKVRQKLLWIMGTESQRQTVSSMCANIPMDDALKDEIPVKNDMYPKVLKYWDT